MERKALEAGKERARELLKTAAKLELTFAGEQRATLRITNLTGHKLPTGYPEGRRMWVHAEFADADGRMISQIGQYGEKKDTLFGNPVAVPTLLDAEATRVYESLPGLSDEQAAKHGKPAGASFHFVLNDVIVKDNRIPPKGFNNHSFAEHQCEPIAATYADGQHWDDVKLALPAGTVNVHVRLMYQVHPTKA